ncbi:MAG: hypothetical protein DK305_000226 [Chloroflexi bacterium]|jgi:hypothetical protein|nr:MAG: hypothetical protein DK305_000226 [Chloroflexota bacterium]
MHINPVSPIKNRIDKSIKKSCLPKIYREMIFSIYAMNHKISTYISKNLFGLCLDLDE